MERRTSNAALWVRWVLGSAVTGALAFWAVFAKGYDSAILLGWAVGMVFAAVLIMFRRAA